MVKTLSEVLEILLELALNIIGCTLEILFGAWWGEFDVPDTKAIVEWSAIERCRSEYEVERVHLEAEEIKRRFGEFSRYQAARREKQIEDCVSGAFGTLLDRKDANKTDAAYKDRRFRLGFDVAASGQGDLATLYIPHRASRVMFFGKRRNRNPNRNRNLPTPDGLNPTEQWLTRHRLRTIR